MNYHWTIIHWQLIVEMGISGSNTTISSQFSLVPAGRKRDVDFEFKKNSNKS